MTIRPPINLAELHRPRDLRWGIGDGDAGSGSFDPADPGGNPLSMGALPLTATGAVDWSQLTNPFPIVSAADFTLPTQAPSLGDLFSQITKAGTSAIGAQSQLTTAQNQAAILKAQQAAQLAAAKAGIKTAGQGLPSPTLLLIGGAALLAILALKK
jgi:hypothetical protein